MTAYNWELRTNLKHLKLHGMLNVLTCLLLHCDNTLRCWPLKTTIEEETDFGKVAVADAIRVLQERKAIILVPPDKRVGVQKSLPDTRYVYQLTGVLVIDGVESPYLHLTPEGWANVRQQIEDLAQEELQQGSSPEPSHEEQDSPAEPYPQQGSPKDTQQDSLKDTQQGSPNAPHKIIQKDNQDKVSTDSSPDKEQKKTILAAERPSPIVTAKSDSPSLSPWGGGQGVVLPPVPIYRAEAIVANFVRTTLRGTTILPKHQPDSYVLDHLRILGAPPDDPQTLLIQVDNDPLRQALDQPWACGILQTMFAWWKQTLTIKFVAATTSNPLPPNALGGHEGGAIPTGAIP